MIWEQNGCIDSIAWKEDSIGIFFFIVGQWLIPSRSFLYSGDFGVFEYFFPSIFFSFECLCFTDEMSAIDHIVHPKTWKVWRICYHQDFLRFLVNIWCVVLIFHICQGRMMTCKWICDEDECPVRSYPFSDQWHGKLCCPGNSLLEKVLF